MSDKPNKLGKLGPNWYDLFAEEAFRHHQAIEAEKSRHEKAVYEIFMDLLDAVQSLCEHQNVQRIAGEAWCKQCGKEIK